MALKVYWTNFAKNELRGIFDFYVENANLLIAQEIPRKIVKETIRLSSHPEIGQIEEYLIGRKEEFRYIVCSNYKIIYCINKTKNRLEINDVFDTRQNPKKISRNK